MDVLDRDRWFYELRILGLEFVAPFVSDTDDDYRHTEVKGWAMIGTCFPSTGFSYIGTAALFLFYSATFKVTVDGMYGASDRVAEIADTARDEAAKAIKNFALYATIVSTVGACLLAYWGLKRLWAHCGFNREGNLPALDDSPRWRMPLDPEDYSPTLFEISSRERRDKAFRAAGAKPFREGTEWLIRPKQLAWTSAMLDEDDKAGEKVVREWLLHSIWFTPALFGSESGTGSCQMTIKNLSAGARKIAHRTAGAVGLISTSVDLMGQVQGGARAVEIRGQPGPQEVRQVVGERLQRSASEPLALHDAPPGTCITVRKGIGTLTPPEAGLQGMGYVVPQWRSGQSSASNWGSRETTCPSPKAGRAWTPPTTPKRGGERATTSTSSPRSVMPPSPAASTPRRGAAATLAAEKHVREADAMRTALHVGSQKSLYEAWQENERLRHEIEELQGQMDEERRRHQAHVREAVAAVQRMADGNCKINLHWSGAAEEVNSSWVDEAVSALCAARHCSITAMSPWVDSDRITQALSEAATEDRHNEVNLLVDMEALASGKPVAMKLKIFDMAEAGVNVRQARGQALQRLYAGPRFVGAYGAAHVKGLRICPWRSPSRPGSGPQRLFVGSHNFTMAAERTNIEIMMEIIQDVATEDGPMARWDEGFSGIFRNAEGAIGATDTRPSTSRRYSKKGPMKG